MIDFFLEPFFIWIPIILLTILFFKYKTYYTPIIFILPAYLFLLFLNPTCKTQVSNKKKEVRLFIDQSYSSQFINKNLKEKVLSSLQDKYNITDKNLYNFQSIPIDIKRLFENKNIQSNKSLFAHQTNIVLNQNNKITNKYYSIYLTDKSYSTSKKNILSLPLKKNIYGIFDVIVPRNCYIGEICTFSILIKSNEKATLSLIINNKIMKKNSIREKYNKQTKIEYQISSKAKPQNLFGYFLYESKNKNELIVKKLPFLISLKKGLPNGAVYFSSHNLLSWRLSYVLKKNLYWNLSQVNNKTTIKAIKSKKYKKKYDFFIEMIKNINLREISQNQIPVLYIWINGSNQFFQEKSKLKLFTKISKDLYQSNHTYVAIWNVPPKNDNIFLSTEELEKQVELFSENLQSTNNIFQGSYIETLKPLYISKKIHQKFLIYKNNSKNSKIFVSEAENNQKVFILPFWGKYSYNNTLNFESGVQKKELLDIYSYKKQFSNINNSKKILKKFYKNFENYKKNNSNVYLSNIVFSLGFLTSTNISFLFVIISMLILFTILIYFWYFR